MAGFITPPPGLLPEAEQPEPPERRTEQTATVNVPRFFATGTPGLPAPAEPAAQVPAAPPATARPEELAPPHAEAVPAPPAPSARGVSSPPADPAREAVPAPPAPSGEARPAPDAAPPTRIVPSVVAPAPVGAADSDADTPATHASPASAGWSLTGPGGDRIDLPATLYVGRAPRLPGESQGALLALPDQGTVSKTHAVLRVAGDSLTIEDLGSTNGTAVIIGSERTILTPRVPFTVRGAAELWLAEARLRLQRR